MTMAEKRKKKQQRVSEPSALQNEFADQIDIFSGPGQLADVGAVNDRQILLPATLGFSAPCWKVELLSCPTPATPAPGNRCAMVPIAIRRTLE
jgi:hypothetical protein